MKYYIVILTLVASLSGAFLLNTARAESKAEKYLGPPEMCLDSTRIKESLILDDQTILFKMLGGQIYLNRLTVPCVGLKMGNGFGYSTSLSKLCKQDPTTVIESGSGLGSTCLLGDFLPFKYEGESKDAIKLLKDSLLKELVAEGAFKETFPDKR